MQHKRRGKRLKPVLYVLGLAVVVGIIVLMMKDIPAPQAPVEKELDAKTFLEPKPQQ